MVAVRGIMTWLELVGGTPPEPRSLYEESFPSPDAFLADLCLALAGVALPNAHSERYESKLECGAVGTRGTSEIGFRFAWTESYESSSIDNEVEEETYGVPGVELRWWFRFQHVGQAGRVGYRHGSLQAQFSSADARDTFEALWRKRFGVEPRFAPCAALHDLSLASRVRAIRTPTSASE